MNTLNLSGTVLPSHIPPVVLPTMQDSQENDFDESESDLEIPNQPFEPDKVPPLEEHERGIPQEG